MSHTFRNIRLCQPVSDSLSSDQDFRQCDENLNRKTHYPVNYLYVTLKRWHAGKVVKSLVDLLGRFQRVYENSRQAITLDKQNCHLVDVIILLRSYFSPFLILSPPVIMYAAGVSVKARWSSFPLEQKTLH